MAQGIPDDELAAIKVRICLEELNERETERDGQIQYIRDWITKHKWITCRTDDAFILRFLRVAKYIIPKAQKRIENFCKVRSSETDGEPQWFNAEFTEKKTMDYLRKGWVYKLPGLDEKGRIVVMTKFGVIKPKGLDTDALFRSSCLFFDWLLQFEECQIAGLIFIEDAAGISLDHMTKFPHDLMKRSMSIWQDVSPMRLKELHYINMASFMNAFMEIFKKLAPKYGERMKIHWKPEDIFKKIPKRMLPKEYGGDAGTIKDLVDASIDGIVKSKGELDSLRTCAVDDSKRPKDIPEGDGWGMVGSYRKINTD
ncbi:alpha-tocopherol transfer protein-like isoform X2 [Lineus longissimus]